MFRIIMAIVIGIAIGYFVGFKDAQTNRQNVVERVISKTGGGLRNNRASPDEQMEKVSR
jgi:uncharacterized membrane-anchored protein YhcB (DUF1043 family)